MTSAPVSTPVGDAADKAPSAAQLLVEIALVLTMSVIADAQHSSVAVTSGAESLPDQTVVATAN